MARQGTTREFKVFGSNALRLAMLSCFPAFERAHGLTVAVEFAATNHTLERMRRGDTADLIIVTSAAIAELAGAGKIIADSCVDLATAGVGACVRAGAPKPDISTVEALKRTLLDAKSVSYSRAGQSGVHFAKMIVQLGIADIVNAKAVINPSGLVGEVIARGDAELGFQQVSEILAVSEVDLVGPLPDAVQLNSVFAAGIGTGSEYMVQARALIRELQSPTTADTMRKSGLTPI